MVHEGLKKVLNGVVAAAQAAAILAIAGDFSMSALVREVLAARTVGPPILAGTIALGAGAVQGLLPPGVPIHGVVRVLEEVGARFLSEPVVRHGKLPEPV